ncbi:MAG: MFS transporter [Rhizomicrobium sp.]|jgi:MHS family proline/betaine transporter-like MFS transporter
MTISLIEEFLLLVLEDKGGHFSRISETSLSCGLAGAALIDLEIRGRIETDPVGLWVADASPTGSEILDALLADIAAEPERLHPKDWIARLMPRAAGLRNDALRTLCERGILMQEDHLYLWVLQDRRYPIEHGEERRECKRRIVELLFNEELPGHHDVALVALADACGMFRHILSHATLTEVAQRIAQLRGLDLIGAEIAHTAEKMNREIRAAERRIVVAGLAGNVMEWYDFGTYGFFAAVLGRQFFPAHDATVSLLASFAVFAIGFIGRPLGALIFGHIGDRSGRKRALMASVLMMAVPTMLIGLLPTYEQIGIGAPIFLILLRLFQGLAVGGEFTTSMVLLVEGAQRSRRAFVGSFAPFGAVGGMLIGSAVGAAITGFLPADAIAAWGWRAAFMFGLVIGAMVLYVRRRLPADAAIVAIAESRHSPVVTAFRTQWRTILKIIGIIMTLGIGFYLNFVYLSTWLVQYAHISHSRALALNCLGLALQLPLLPLAGTLADRIGTKAVLLLSTIGFALLAWPLYALISQGTMAAIIGGQAVLALLQSGISAAVPSFMVESLPKHVRCTALSFGQNLAQACFGGTVPMVAVALIGATGNPLSPALYLAAAGVVSFVVVLFTNVLPEDVPAEVRVRGIQRA